MSHPRPGAGTQPGDWLYRLFAWLQHVTPVFLYAWLAQHVMGPVRSARIVSFLPVGSLSVVVASLPASFSAQVAPHLTGATRAKLVQALPIATLVAVTRELFAQKNFAEAARFGVLMTASQVKALVIAQNDPDGMAHTARYYNAAEIVRVAHAFSGPYLARLAAALDRNGYYQVEAELGVALPVVDVAALMKSLTPAQAMRFLVRCNDQRLNDVLGRLPDDRRNTVMQALLDEKVSSRGGAR